MTSSEAYRLNIPKRDCPNVRELPAAVKKRAPDHVLRWAVAEATATTWIVDITTDPAASYELKSDVLERDATSDVVVNVVPTGVGCETGGFAGDASPACKLLATAADYLVTNPNAVNASDFYGGGPKTLYVEGSVLDAYLNGDVTLRIPFANRVGLVIERSDDMIIDHAINVANAVSAVHGITVKDVAITSERFRPRCVRLGSGVYTGTITYAAPLLDACAALVDRGCSALAIASIVDDLPHADYEKHFMGEHPNPVGGAEAVVSHVVSHMFRLPCAHAPLINHRAPLSQTGIVDGRSSGEAVSVSGLACVILGLAKAPQFRTGVVPTRTALPPACVRAVVCPDRTMGGPGVISAYSRGLPVIAVKGGAAIDVSAAALGMSGVYSAANYLEAAGLLHALREGIDPGALARPAVPVSIGNRNGV
jgi:hypothetical protein